MFVCTHEEIGVRLRCICRYIMSINGWKRTYNKVSSSIFYFPPNIRGIACWAAELNTALSHQSEEIKMLINNNSFFEWKSNPKPSRLVTRFSATTGFLIIFFIYYLKNNIRKCSSKLSGNEQCLQTRWHRVRVKGRIWLP